MDTGSKGKPRMPGLTVVAPGETPMLSSDKSDSVVPKFKSPTLSPVDSDIQSQYEPDKASNMDLPLQPRNLDSSSEFAQDLDSPSPRDINSALDIESPSPRSLGSEQSIRSLGSGDHGVVGIEMPTLGAKQTEGYDELEG